MEETIANIEIELYVKDRKNFVYLSDDGSSGVNYEFKDRTELCNIISAYVEDLISFNILLSNKIKS